MKAELAAVTAERDSYLEMIRETFRVLESRGQAPDDNAPLQVTARRVLDFLDKVTAERDALAAQLAALRRRLADAEWIRVHASMSNGIARYLIPPTNVSAPGRYALVRLEDGEK